MAIPRYAILNLLRDNIGLPRVDYTDADWATSSAATDPVHSETILVGDLWQTMKEVAASSRDKWERRKLRVIAEQYEYPLPSDCMCVWSLLHDFNGTWYPLDYLYHEQFFTGFSENAQSYPPRHFTLQAQTSNPVHYQGTITSDNDDTPPMLVDTSANFGITLTGEEINPDDKIFNITDDSSGYVDSLFFSSNKTIGICETGSNATTLYDSTGSFVTTYNVAVGDIVSRYSFTHRYAYGIISSVSDTTLTFSRLYNHEAGYVAGQNYQIGTSDIIYLTSSGLVADTEEGIVGGAENDFDEDDEYQVEDYYSTLDTLLLSSMPSTSDTLGTESLTLIYIPYPKQPAQYYHPIELSEAYTPAILAKMAEYAKARERGDEPNYEYLLDKAIGQRKIYNQGRMGNTRRPAKMFVTNTASWQDTDLVDHRGI